jgi:putative nucleotidyltransferase with HDIG domain
MRKAAYYYVAAVFLTATLLVANVNWQPAQLLSIHDVLGIAAFAALGILSEGMSVRLAASKNGALSSIVFLPLFASAVIFPPIVVICIAIVIQLFVEIFLLPKVLWRTVFNVSQYAFAYGIAALCYHEVAVLVPMGGGIHALAFLMMALTFFLLNQLAVAAFIGIRERRKVKDVLHNTLFKGASNILFDLIASPIAIITVILYREMYIGGLLLILLPFYLVRYSNLTAQKLQQANADLLTVFVKTIETRDPYTSGHSLRVATLARILAEDMKYSPRMVDQIEQAALLHDVGKIDSVYAPLISKPFDLTVEERELIQTHAIRGAELLATLTSLPQSIVKAVRHHHERYDGQGYPNGLKGTEIPIAARVIMLCDSIDAMLSDRPYRSALSIPQVRSELVRCSGSQFDPHMVEAILEKNTLERAAAVAAISATGSEINILSLRYA